jgi:radical SAM protein with 4Fe4S-binding SPASM domain
MSNVVKGFKVFKRNEFFGSILYDSHSTEYLYCDKLVTFLIDNNIRNINQINHVKLREFGVDKSECEEIVKDLNSIIEYKEIVDLKNKPIDNILSAPLRVFLDFTYSCNLRCVHCFTNSGVKSKSELSFEQKKSIINQMVRMGCFRISLAGGEPLILDEFFPFVEYALDNNVDVSFTTNGTLIDVDIIKRLNKLKIRTITVSLDGTNKFDNDMIRGNGSFDKLINSMDLLAEHYDGKVALRMTIMKHNFLKANEYIDLAKKLNCSKVKFNVLRLTGRARENSDLYLSPDEYVGFVKSMQIQEHEDIDVILPLNPFQRHEHEYIKELGFGCVAGKDCMTISPCGYVRPCSQLDEKYADGNAKTHALIDIWEKGKVFNEYRNLKGNSKCNSCEVYDKCRGGCRYRALQEGDLNGVDPFCYKCKM